MEHNACTTKFLSTATLVGALKARTKYQTDIKVGADSHPLLIFLLLIIVCSFLALSFF
jgi:hypothetical protein